MLRNLQQRVLRKFLRRQLRRVGAPARLLRWPACLRLPAAGFCSLRWPASLQAGKAQWEQRSSLRLEAASPSQCWSKHTAPTSLSERLTMSTGSTLRLRRRLGGTESRIHKVVHGRWLSTRRLETGRIRAIRCQEAGQTSTIRSRQPGTDKEYACRVHTPRAFGSSCR